MSIILDGVLAQAANGSPATVALSAESVAVLLFGSQLLQDYRNWLDKDEDPLDEITPIEAHTIETITSNAYVEIMTPIIGFCFPLLTTLPANSLLLDGATYAREDYPILYSLLDAVYIIDADNFFVPDFRSRIPIGVGTGTGLSTYAVNDTGGTEEETLDISQIPSHQHSISLEVPIIAAPGAIPINSSTGVMLGGTGFTGGDAPHNNLQPYVAVNWAVIAL